MKLYVICLERLPMRRKFVEDGLKRVGSDYEVFRGVDASRGEHEAISLYNERACIRYFGVPLSLGEIGAFASHYLLWKKCVDRGEAIAVVEDDVWFLPSFPEALVLANERIEEHRFIRLSGWFQRAYRVIENIGETHKLVRYLRGPAGAQCYCLSPNGAAALLERADRWIEPVDLYMDRFWIHHVASKALLPFAAFESDREKLPSAVGDRISRRGGLATLRREFNRNKDLVARFTCNLIYR